MYLPVVRLSRPDASMLKESPHVFIFYSKHLHILQVFIFYREILHFFRVFTILVGMQFQERAGLP